MSKLKKMAMFTAMSVCLSSFLYSGSTVKAEQTEWNFDFGSNGVADGYIGVDASTAYDYSKGYGFADTSLVRNLDASGSDELSDSVWFTSTDTSNTFNVDLPNGLYEMTVTLGNTTRASVWAEDVLQIINMTGNNAVDTIQIPVTDGQLNIMITEGKAGTLFTLSSLKLKKISDDTTMKPTIWSCGDSTVCNYYPRETSVQAGWVQMLGNYVDTDKFEIRNMASSGQYAKGFVDAGQFDAIEKYGKAGDYYIISIGINDTNYSNREEYKQTVTEMVEKAKSLGMKVILVKQQGRADDISRSKLLSGRWFGDTLDEIATEQDVQVIDLFNLAQDYWLSIGQDAVYNLFMTGDTLHPNREGADKLAELVSSQIDFNDSNNSDNSSNNYTEKNISNNPTIYMLGDSTMCNYNASSYPQTGWGQLIGNYFDDNVTIDNRARGGRSSKMIINEGIWDSVYNSLNVGDYVFISFGINDANYNNEDRYAPVSDGTFQNCIRTFVEGALEKGATPVLFTTVLGLASYQNGEFVNSYTEYCQATKDIASEYGIACIDLNSLMVERYNEVGYDTAYTYHMISAVDGSTDRTHFTETGANVVAEIVSEAIANSNLYLSNFILDDQQIAVIINYGDVNNDGIINAFDLCEMKRAYYNGGADTSFDLNQNDEFDLNDIELLQAYLLQ